MNTFDYHLHTNHSMDSTMTVDELCGAAIQAGLQEICITEHTEFGHPDPNADRPPVIKDWMQDIQTAQKKYSQLIIRAGIEIGDNPLQREYIRAWHAALPVDYLLLSLHLIDNEDPYYPDYFNGKMQTQVYRRYVESKLSSALSWDASDYDAMAHLGYCAKFAPYPLAERPLRWRHAPDLFDALFSHLAQQGKALEINTSGMRTMNECIPGRELLVRFHELGGEFVTLGSDAHKPEHVGNWINEARELAMNCGLRYAMTFAKRVGTPVRL